MTTVGTYIFRRKMRHDGTWCVYIVVTHERKQRYIPTSVYVEKTDLTPSFKIKNAMIIEKLEGLVHEFRKRIYALDIELNGIDIDQLVKLITVRSGGSICISDYFDGIWLRENADKKGLRNYTTAMNKFKYFLGRGTIMASDITVKNMKEFELYLKEWPRAVSLYCSCVAKIFSDACLYYNDEDNGLIVIKHSLTRYHAPKQNVARKRALPVDDIRRLFELPYDNIRVKGLQSRHDLALDCFRLSFCLLGMNSADMYSAKDYRNGVISYYREKTKDRRNDMAFMQVAVLDYIRPLFEKYKDDVHVFNFHRRFSSAQDLNRAINIGLKEVGKELGIENLQFYAARHSMASIAVNKAGIDRWTVNAMLNHTDVSMRVTELYIERDFTPLNMANKKLLDFVFGYRLHDNSK